MKKILFLISLPLFVGCSSSDNDSRSDYVKEALGKVGLNDESVISAQYDDYGNVFFLGETSAGKDKLICYDIESKSELFQIIGLEKDNEATYNQPYIGEVTYPLIDRSVSGFRYKNNSGFAIIENRYSEIPKGQIIPSTKVFCLYTLYFITDGVLKNSGKGFDDMSYEVDWYNNSVILKYNGSYHCLGIDGNEIYSSDMNLDLVKNQGNSNKYFPYSYKNYFLVYDFDSGIVVCDRSVRPFSDCNWSISLDLGQRVVINDTSWEQQSETAVLVDISYTLYSGDKGSVTIKIDTDNRSYEILD